MRWPRGGRAVAELVEELTAFPARVDERGTLLPIELDDVGFVVRRIFTVTGTSPASTRGEHLTDCHELIVLIQGEVEVTTRSLGVDRRVTLDRPGATIEVVPDTFIRYRLRDDASTILVLADKPFRQRA